MNDNCPAINSLLGSPYPCQIVMNVHNRSARAACLYVPQIPNVPPLCLWSSMGVVERIEMPTRSLAAVPEVSKLMNMKSVATRSQAINKSWETRFYAFFTGVVLISDSLSAPWSGPYVYLTSNIALEKKFSYFVFGVHCFSHLSRMIKITNCRVCLTFGTY